MNNRFYRALSILTCLLFLCACNSNMMSNMNAADKPISNKHSDQIEPYVLKGRVVDAHGRPLVDVKVFADNQLLYNSNLVFNTDVNGDYRIELPSTANTWKAGGQYTALFNDVEYSFSLTPDVDKPFAGNTGAIRDFTWEDLTRELYVYKDLGELSSEHSYEVSDLELTLTPIGSIIDGSQGLVITINGREMDQGGYILAKVPVGKYKATAQYTSDGHNTTQLLIRDRGEDEYANSVEFEFTRNTLYYVQGAALEVKHP